MLYDCGVHVRQGALRTDRKRRPKPWEYCTSRGRRPRGLPHALEFGAGRSRPAPPAFAPAQHIERCQLRRGVALFFSQFDPDSARVAGHPIFNSETAPKETTDCPTVWSLNSFRPVLALLAVATRAQTVLLRHPGAFNPARSVPLRDQLCQLSTVLLKTASSCAGRSPCAGLIQPQKVSCVRRSARYTAVRHR